MVQWLARVEVGAVANKGGGLVQWLTRVGTKCNG